MLFCFHAQHDFCCENPVFTGKAAGTVVFLRKAAYGLDSDAISRTLGGLKNTIFLFDFAVKGIFHLDQKKTVILKINRCIDFSSGRLCPLTCLDGIFQKIGKDETHVNFIDANLRRNICLSMKGDGLTFCKGRIVAQYAVSSLIFTKMKLLAWNFADG